MARARSAMTEGPTGAGGPGGPVGAGGPGGPVGAGGSLGPVVEQTQFRFDD
jgi:hypothetical protein